jgi:DNA repair photolyase
LVERDLDILAEMARRKLATVAITITTLDPKLSRHLEPRAASPRRRLESIRRLTEAGIPVSVSVAPVIPFITEQELERVLTEAAASGAGSAHYIVLRLPWELNTLFQDWLQTHFPDRALRVMNRVRDMRGGKDYDSRFGHRMHGEGVWAELIRKRFSVMTRRLKLAGGHFMMLDCSQFRRPLAVPAGESGTQMDIFG